MRRPAVAASLAILLLLAGCVGDSGKSSTSRPPATPLRTGFDDVAVGAVPSNWMNTGAIWSVVSHPNATSGDQVLRGEGSPTKGRTSLLATPAGHHGDFEATVRFQLISGDHPQGAGLSFRFQDETHYTLIRYSNSEQGWHLFVADGGEVDKKNDATLGISGDLPVFNQWIDLRIVAQGDHIQAWWGTMKVIDYTETSSTVARSGSVGPFLRGQTVAIFDDLDVKAL